MLGVMATESPYVPTRQSRSSEMMKRTLGGDFSAAKAKAEARKIALIRKRWGSIVIIVQLMGIRFLRREAFFVAGISRFRLLYPDRNSIDLIIGYLANDYP